MISRIVDVLASIQLVDRDGSRLSCPEVTSDAYANLMELGSIIEPTLQRFFIVSELLEHGSHLTLREVESTAGTIGHQLSVFYGINAPEFFDKSLFSTLIATLKARQIIGHQQQQLSLYPAFKLFRQTVQGSLEEDIKVNVRQLVRRHLTQSVDDAYPAA